METFRHVLKGPPDTSTTHDSVLHDLHLIPAVNLCILLAVVFSFYFTHLHNSTDSSYFYGKDGTLGAFYYFFHLSVFSTLFFTKLGLLGVKKKFLHFYIINYITNY